MIPNVKDHVSLHLDHWYKLSFSQVCLKSLDSRRAVGEFCGHASVDYLTRDILAGLRGDEYREYSRVASCSADFGRYW